MKAALLLLLYQCLIKVVAAEFNASITGESPTNRSHDNSQNNAKGPSLYYLFFLLVPFGFVFISIPCFCLRKSAWLVWRIFLGIVWILRNIGYATTNFFSKRFSHVEDEESHMYDKLTYFEFEQENHQRICETLLKMSSGGKLTRHNLILDVNKHEFKLNKVHLRTALCEIPLIMVEYIHHKIDVFSPGSKYVRFIETYLKIMTDESKFPNFLNYIKENAILLPSDMSIETTVSPGTFTNKCPICLNNIHPFELVYVLPCIHHCHFKCLENWCNVRGACPSCNFDLKMNYIKPLYEKMTSISILFEGRLELENVERKFWLKVDLELQKIASASNLENSL